MIAGLEYRLFGDKGENMNHCLALLGRYSARHGRRDGLHKWSAVEIITARESLAFPEFDMNLTRAASGQIEAEGCKILWGENYQALISHR